MAGDRTKIVGKDDEITACVRRLYVRKTEHCVGRTNDHGVVTKPLIVHRRGAGCAERKCCRSARSHHHIGRRHGDSWGLLLYQNDTVRRADRNRLDAVQPWRHASLPLIIIARPVKGAILEQHKHMTSPGNRANVGESAHARPRPRTASPLDKSAIGQQCHGISVIGKYCADAGQAGRWQSSSILVVLGARAITPTHHGCIRLEGQGVIDTCGNLCRSIQATRNKCDIMKLLAPSGHGAVRPQRKREISTGGNRLHVG